MSERTPERRPLEASEKLEQKEGLRNQILESDSDLRIKEVFLSVITEIKPAMQADAEWMRKLVQELKEREMSFPNFVSPENMLWQSTWIRWDGKTFSSDRLDTVESMHNAMNFRMLGLTRMEWLIKSGARLEDIKKDPLVIKFLTSPEGKLLEWVIFSQKDPQLLESEYYLAKARELRTSIIRWDELAQDWYNKLKWTPLETVAEKEKMSLGDHALWKGREFANSMLGLDSLAAMVAWAGLGRLAGTLISTSDKLRNTSLAVTTAMNESMAAKLIPWVNALKSKAWETGLKMFMKWSANFFAEITKWFTYTEIARAVWGEKAAHAMSYPLMFIPGLKWQFEATMNVRLAENPENFKKFGEWIVQKYKTPEKFEQAMEVWLKEAYNRSKSSVGIEEARQLYSEIRASSRTLFEHFGKKIKETKEAPNQTTWTRAWFAEKLWAVEGQNVKLQGTPSNGSVSQEFPVGLEKEVPPNIGAVQENTKVRVGEVMKAEPELQELIDVWLPKDYVLALQELGISNRDIMRFKGWGEKSLHREVYINNYLEEFNREAIKDWRPTMTTDEAHALFWYTTQLYYKTINGKLWKGDGDGLKITEILRSALSKMPKAHPTQYRWDDHLLNGLLKQHGLIDAFNAWEQIPTEALRKLLLGKQLELKWFTSSSDKATEPFWGWSKYQMEIHDSDAHDITKLAFYPNYWDERPGWVKTDQESLFMPWTLVEIQEIFQAVDPKTWRNFITMIVKRIENK